MGGDNQGFMVSDLEQILEDATESPETEKIEKAQEEISEMLKQLDVGVDVSSDSDKDLISQKVISIEEAPLDVEMYCVSELENGDTIFVNDILVGVWRD
jgi:hypothetical protein